MEAVKTQKTGSNKPDPNFNFRGVRTIEAKDLKEDTKKNKTSLEQKHKITPKPDADNWQSVLESLKIDANQTYKEPPICIEIEDKDGPCRFASLGNFSAVIGKAKSRKTFLITLLLGAALKKEIL